ncbi:hypothetical protein MASR2M74_02710 [Paracoccaceae bacterium]
MQMDEAKEAISRLIRDAVPAAPAPGSAQGGINFFGGTNVVQIHMSMAPQPMAEVALEQPKVELAPHPAIRGRRREILLSRIAASNEVLKIRGKRDYHLRFAHSVFGHGNLSLLDHNQIERIVAFMEHEAAL